MDYEDWLEENPIKKHLKKTGKSQTQFAQQVDTSLNSLYKWLQGIADPSDVSLDKIIGVIGESFPKQWETWKTNIP